MISVETWPQPAVRLWTLAQRFQKFLVVGAVGLMVNQIGLFGLHDLVDVAVIAASPVAIFLSMIVTFILNERWTWHDRGNGRILHRGLLYGSINSGGLLINWLTLVLLHRIGLDYLVANLIGAGIAAVWNFSLNHALTWRR